MPAHDTLDALAARVATRQGAESRPHSDVVNDTIISNRAPLVSPSRQRNVFDAYDEGALIWLNVAPAFLDRAHRKDAHGVLVRGGSFRIAR